MNKTYLIFKYEFINQMKRKGFIIMTLIVPLIFLLGIGIFQIVSGIITPSTEITNIGCVDTVGNFNQYTSQGSFNLVLYSPGSL